MSKYTVQAGDTLAAIAKRHLGDASLYQLIADENGLTDPGSIRVGQELLIPDLEDKESTGDSPDPAETIDSIVLEQLVAIMPVAKKEILSDFVDGVNKCLEKYQINTPLRSCHFLAQVAHESGAFRFVKENLNYSANALKAVFGKYFTDDASAEEYARKPEMIANRVYADRMGNSDEASGDGWKYRGRGLIQLTGKSNYQQYSDDNDIDIVNEPDQVADDPLLAIDVAGWYWHNRQLNKYADADDIDTITRRINGGLNGLEDRKEYLERAKNILIS